MVLSVTLNPSIDHTLFVKSLVTGDTNRIELCETDAGGKGVNLSRIVAEMDGQTAATGLLGGPSGAMVLHVLQDQGVADRFVRICGETRTNFNIESMAGGPPTTLNARGPEISPDELDALRAQVEKESKGAAWVAIGGSLPPGVPTSIYQELVSLARESGAKVLLDADGEPMRLGLESKPDMVKPNQKEAERLVGRSLNSTAELVDAAEELLQHLAHGGIAIISRGSDGAVMASGGQRWIGHAPKVESRSTVGSGDSLLGGFLAKLVAGEPLDECLRWGIAAGAATACTNGAEIGRRSVIETLYTESRVEQA